MDVLTNSLIGMVLKSMGWERQRREKKVVYQYEIEEYLLNSPNANRMAFGLLVFTAKVNVNHLLAQIVASNCCKSVKRNAS